MRSIPGCGARRRSEDGAGAAAGPPAVLLPIPVVRATQACRQPLQGVVYDSTGAVLPAVRDIRRFGSCALDLCMVAAGGLDAYYEDGVHVWDWAAAALIAAEAGATLRLPASDGTPGLIIACAPGISDALAAVLNRAGAV